MVDSGFSVIDDLDLCRSFIYDVDRKEIVPSKTKKVSGEINK